MYGMMIDVSVAAILILATAFTDIRWTADYWLALAGLEAKTILQSSVAYLVRRFVQPYLQRH
jgi:hypothetical protein